MSEEIREWVKFALIIVGLIIALRTYIVSQRQRRLENSLKLIELFFNNLQEGDIASWKQLFINSSESSGSGRGGYISDNGNDMPFSDLFSEGPDDGGALERIAEQIDLISYEILQKSIDARVIYSQLGQLFHGTYGWLKEIDSSFLPDYYPSFYKIMNKYKHSFSKWPCKTFSHCE